VEEIFKDGELGRRAGTLRAYCKKRIPSSIGFYFGLDDLGTPISYILMSSSLTPRPERMLCRAWSIRARKQGSCSNR
jgi:hypothetical protein